MITSVFKPLMTSLYDCGEWMASALISPDFKTGGFYLDNHADPVPPSKINNTNAEARAKLVEHFKQETAVSA